MQNLFFVTIKIPVRCLPSLAMQIIFDLANAGETARARLGQEYDFMPIIRESRRQMLELTRHIRMDEQNFHRRCTLRSQETEYH